MQQNVTIEWKMVSFFLINLICRWNSCEISNHCAVAGSGWRDRNIRHTNQKYKLILSEFLYSMLARWKLPHLQINNIRLMTQTYQIVESFVSSGRVSMRLRIAEWWGIQFTSENRKIKFGNKIAIDCKRTRFEMLIKVFNPVGKENVNGKFFNFIKSQRSA